MNSSLRITLSLALALTLVVSTIPVAAADIAPRNSTLGFVTGAGNVQLRGVWLSREGTVFSGDQIRTGEKAYAKVSLKNGNRFELSTDTELALSRTDDNVRMNFTAGNVAFSASQTPVEVAVGNFRVEPKANSKGGVMFITDDLVGIRVDTGSITVRNTKSQKSMNLAAGSARIISLKNEDPNVPIAQLASAFPTSLPSSMNMPRQGGPWSGKKTAGVVAGVLAGVVVIALVATRGCEEENASPSRPC